MTDDAQARTDRRDAILRALLAAALAGGAHVAVFAWLTTHTMSTEKDSVLGAPIELDLLAAAPPEPPRDVAPPAPTAPEPPPPTPDPTPTQDADPTPPPPAQEDAPPPTPDPPTPTPTKAAPPDAVTAPPPPKPKPHNLKPTPSPQARAEEKERARDARRQRRADAQAAPEARPRDDSRQDASARPVSSGSDVSTWRGEVMARISEFKPSSVGVSGTAVVAFTVDAGGRVVSAGVVRSSGDASLDAASVAMVRRASPVPAPPAELGGRVRLSVPVRFQ